MPSHFVLVAGPLVRASSWESTARLMREAGCLVQVPDILAHHPSPPAWRAWTQSLLEHIAPAGELVLVGHSSASALVADLAIRLPVRGVIIVDGDIPPLQGAASPVRPALHDFIRSLAGADGTLPVWSKWFAGDAQRSALIGLDILAGDPPAFAQFEDGLPRMHLDWFDDTIELAAWDHIPAGFIQTSGIYDHATAEAQRRGWPVMRPQGTHLDPTLRPAVTADAILSMSRQLGTNQ
jgi:Alpha/beta hydrolase family